MKASLSVAIIGVGLLVASCDYKPMNQGQSLYRQHCQSCHMEEGQGLGELYPPVANSDYIKENSEKLACLIRHGIAGEIMVNGVAYNAEMSGYPQLTENEISNLVYFLTVEWNGQTEPYTLKEVKDQLSDCPISRD